MATRKPIIEEWPGIWAKFAYNFCVKNAWKVTVSIGDFDDAMAECACIYYECRQRYGATVNSPAHFMKLYKMMLNSYFWYYAYDDSADREHITREEDACANVSTTQPDLPSFLGARLSRASSELKAVLGIMNSAPQEIMEVLHRDTASPRQFFYNVGKYLGFGEEETASVENELRGLIYNQLV